MHTLAERSEADLKIFNQGSLASLGPSLLFWKRQRVLLNTSSQGNALDIMELGLCNRSSDIEVSHILFCFLLFITRVASIYFLTFPFVIKHLFSEFSFSMLANIHSTSPFRHTSPILPLTMHGRSEVVFYPTNTDIKNSSILPLFIVTPPSVLVDSFWTSLACLKSLLITSLTAMHTTLQ